MRLAVIPARGGSRRIPRKNIKPFRGRPIIAWSIEAALRAECFDRVTVSTDDAEIAEVAARWGAQVPFLRPAELADDYSGTVPVIAHAVDWHRRLGMDIEYACCIYATAPFVRAEDLLRGLDILLEKNCDYAFAVARYSFPIQRALRIKRQGRIEMLHPEHFATRSQDLEEAWHDAGQFYWGRAAAWLAGKPVFSADSFPVILPAERVQDIDTPEDGRRAERLFEALMNADADAASRARGRGEA
jgi:pseudaminic acid cytidylyltransferase